MLTLPVREVLPATPRARIVRLDLAGNRFVYLPGQAVLVASPGKTRQSIFSLASPPEDASATGCLELLIRVDQANGEAISVSPGSELAIRGPIGGFTLRRELAASPLVFIAGGTGIAPVRSMIMCALRTDRPNITLLYSARAPGDFAYENELKLLASQGRICFWQTITREGTSADWTGARGRIGEAALKPFAADRRSLYFICGPLALVSEAQHQLQALGVCREHIYTARW